MKFKPVIVSFCTILGFGLLLPFAKADGPFQLINFNSLVTSTAGQPFSAYIDFLYTGTGTPKMVIIGNPLPSGLRVGAISYGENGMDKAEFTNISPAATYYPLVVELSDNYGGLLVEPFDFLVETSTITATVPVPTSLPVPAVPVPTPTPTSSFPAVTPPPSGIFTLNQNLQLGDSGQAVIVLQKFLEFKKFLTLPNGVTEGYFGNITQLALIAFQRSIGLPATGYCGLMTRAAIDSI